MAFVVIVLLIVILACVPGDPDFGLELLEDCLAPSFGCALSSLLLPASHATGSILASMLAEEKAYAKSNKKL